MRITYRHHDNKKYWTKRWTDIPADNAMLNDEKYPLKYALETVKENDGLILEAGCGAGRILRFFHDRGSDIVGIDFIQKAIDQIKDADPTIKAEVGDITSLRFDDKSFKYILAFGLYHNLKDDLEPAIKETLRVLRDDGLVCASFRADNIQNRMNDWLALRKSKTKGDSPKEFHKLNLTKEEFVEKFAKNGFNVLTVYPVVNMPLLYKFRTFRSRSHKTFNENTARAEGYLLSGFGNFIQGFLINCFPNQFCNIYVLIAEKS